MKPDQAAIALRNGQRLDVDLDIAEHAIALTIPYLFRIIDPTQTIGSSGHSKFRQLCDNAGLPGNHPSNAAWMVLRALSIVPGDALMIETGCPFSPGLASALGTAQIGTASCRERWCKYVMVSVVPVYFKKKPAYEMRISDCSSDVCSSDLIPYLFRISDPTQTIGSSGHSKFRQLCDNAGLPGNHPSNAAWMVLRALRIVPGDALMIETGCPISQGLASALGTVHTAKDAYIIRADRTNPDAIRDRKSTRLNSSP